MLYDGSMLFHRDIGFPREFRRPQGVRRLAWTNHALERCRQYGIHRSEVINLDRFEPVEIEITRERGICKIVMRGPSQRTGQHLVIVLIPARDRWTVKTCWLNHESDQHATLDATKYAVPA